jgi:hypothetical protein
MQSGQSCVIAGCDVDDDNSDISLDSIVCSGTVWDHWFWTF